MKLDIEGMEFEVLFDIQEENRKKIQAILCEIHLLSSTAVHSMPSSPEGETADSFRLVREDGVLVSWMESADVQNPVVRAGNLQFRRGHPLH